MKINQTLQRIVVVLVVLCSQPAARALDFKIGALGGYSSTTVSGSSAVSAFGVGGRASYQLMDSFGLAGEFTYQLTTPSTASTGYTSNISDAVVAIDYFPISLLAGLFIGPKAGVGFFSAGGVTATSFAIGGEAGWEYNVWGDFIVGPQVSFISVSSTTSNGTTFASTTVLQAFASVQYKLSLF